MNIKKFNHKLDEVYGIRDVGKESGDEILSDVTGKGGSPVVDISVSNDGKYVASVDSRIHLWDYRSGRKVRSFFSPTRLLSISFTADSKYVVSGNTNGLVQVWDVMNGKINRDFLKS